MNSDEIIKVKEIMDVRFGHDSLIGLATTKDNIPSVRRVNSMYSDGCFYIITYALSNKIKEINQNPNVAVAGEWFSGHGKAINKGFIGLEKNEATIQMLRTAFYAWYHNGHVNEKDQNTIILCIKMTDGVLFADGKRYDVDFSQICDSIKKAKA